MPQAASGSRPQSADRLHTVFALIAGFSGIGALCTLIYLLRPQFANLSTAWCVTVIVGVPLLSIGQFLSQKRRRQQGEEIRDAWRSGISVGAARRPRESTRIAYLTRSIDTGRHAIGEHPGPWPGGSSTPAHVIDPDAVGTRGAITKEL